MNSSQTQTFIESLRRNWFVILFIGSLIIGWTRFDTRLQSVESSTSEQKEDIKMLAAKSQELTSAIIEIKANYIFIKEALTKK